MISLVEMNSPDKVNENKITKHSDLIYYASTKWKETLSDLNLSKKTKDDTSKMESNSKKVTKFHRKLSNKT